MQSVFVSEVEVTENLRQVINSAGKSEAVEFQVFNVEGQLLQRNNCFGKERGR